MSTPFKVPTLPQGQKRKPSSSGGEDDATFKRPKQSHDPLSNPVRQAGPLRARKEEGPAGPVIQRKATVEDEDEEVGDRGGEMDVDMPVEESFEADDGDEEGGRFFGGGTNSTQDQILDLLATDENPTASTETTGPSTVQELRKLVGKFERVVQKNFEARSKYSEQPELFMDSEFLLSQSLHSLLPLSSHPTLFYPELTSSSSNFLPILTNLLTHENPDIVEDVLGVLVEWLDEDTGEDEEEDGDGDGGKEREGRMVLGGLITAFIDNSLLELLTSLLTRFSTPSSSEEPDETSTALYKILQIFENILAFLPPVARQVAETTELVGWLLGVVSPAKGKGKGKEGKNGKGKKEEEVGEVVGEEIRYYAGEVLSMLCQEERAVRLVVGSGGGLDTLMTVISQYRHRDPADMEEAEFMENIFNTLCSVLAEPEMKKGFVEGEGVELMVLLLREKNMARLRAIKVLDYALQTEAGADGCKRFVEAQGLKGLFGVFMGKGLNKKKSHLDSLPPSELDEHLLSLLSSLFLNLPSDSPERIRLLAKFVEEGYEKVDRVLEMREGGVGRVAEVEREIGEEKEAMQANDEEITPFEISEWYLRRLSAGLAQVQNADVVLAWICMEDDGVREHAKMMLDRKGRSFKDSLTVLAEAWQVLTDEEEDEDLAPEEQTEPSLERIVLEQLCTFLDSL